MNNPARRARLGLRAAGVIAVAGAVAVALLVQSAGARPAKQAKAAATHSCLVMTGAGDPAFTKNFNPYTAQGLPSGAFVRGAFYEPLVISSVAGGGHTYPWLAQSWKWSNGNKTLTLNLVKNAKWSDGQPLTSADVAYSLTAGKQDKSMDLVGYASPDTNIASVSTSSRYAVVIKLKTIDSQFIATNINLQFVVP